MINSRNFWQQKPPPSTRINWAHPDAQGLIGFWLLNENGGLTAHDCTQRYGDGTLQGATGQPTWETHQLGIDLSFTAANTQRVNIPDNTNAGLSTTWTIQVVFRVNSNRNFNGLFSKTNSNLGAPFDYFVDSTGALKFNGNAVFGSPPVSAGVWYDLIVSNNGGLAGGSRFSYLFGADGTFVTATAGADTTANGTNAIRIGDRNDDATALDGRILFARIWNREIETTTNFSGEYARLHYEPYGVMLPPRRYFLSPAAVVAPAVIPYVDPMPQLLAQ